MTDLTNEIATDIRDIDNGSLLSADGLATLVMRQLHDKGIIRLDQVREVGVVVAANANMEPRQLASKLVADFHLGKDAGQ